MLLRKKKGDQKEHLVVLHSHSVFFRQLVLFFRERTMYEPNVIS